MFSRFCSESAGISARVEGCDEVKIVLSPSSRSVPCDADSAGKGDGEIGSVIASLAANSSNAFCKRVGNIRPRFCALRRIPRAALALKKNLWGTGLSNTSDNEQTTAALGDSEKLAVKDTPANPIPAFDHENALDFCKVSSVVRTEKSGNILKQEPSGSKLLQESRKLVKESCTRPGESCPFPCNRDILAWDSGTDEINPRQVRISATRMDFGNCVSSTARQNGSFSTCHTVSIPASSNPLSNPPIPANNDPCVT
jgi:hypothetical protein